MFLMGLHPPLRLSFLATAKAKRTNIGRIRHWRGFIVTDNCFLSIFFFSLTLKSRVLIYSRSSRKGNSFYGLDHTVWTWPIWNIGCFTLNFFQGFYSLLSNFHNKCIIKYHYYSFITLLTYLSYLKLVFLLCLWF